MKKIMTLAAGTLLLAACENEKNKYDAMGVFEATEVMVSAKAQGEIKQFSIDDGDQVQAGEIVGMIDVAKLGLQQQSIAENREAQTARLLDLQEQTAAIQQQINNAQREKDRFSKLFAKGAATQKQVDDINYQINVLQKQLTAAQSQLNSANESIARQANATSKQMDVVQSQIDDAIITSPISGIILKTYTEPGEYAIPGKVLFKVADLTEMILRCYITADQYNKIKLHQKVNVFLDGEEDEKGTPKAHEGIITWIASKAEFTPKTIQTKDERANLVYAIKISVKNDGKIKIGQYGDCNFDK